MQINKILVPVDFSEYSDNALEYAIMWAESFGAEITLLHVNTLFHEHHEYEELVKNYQKLIEKHEKEVLEWLKSHARTIAARKVSVQYELLRSTSAPNSILLYLNNRDFDMVIMGTHGRTGLKHLLLGSVAERISRLSPVPVIAVHKDFKKLDVNNILVPIDFSPLSERIVKDALVIANSFSAKIHLLHVMEKITAATFTWLDEEIRQQFDVNEEKKQRVKDALQKYENVLFKTPVEYVIRNGRSYEEIVKYAQEKEIDLIVMATRGYSKFEYFWSLGSTTERVVRLAPCPVFTTGRKKVDHIYEQVAHAAHPTNSLKSDVNH